MDRHDLQALTQRWREELHLLDDAGLTLLALRLDQLLADASVQLCGMSLIQTRTAPAAEL